MVSPGDADLLRNSDLPPPLRLFPDGRAADEHRRLLRALRLSQTRAREAEQAAAALTETNRRLTSLLMRESMRLLAHRQWLRLLEAEMHSAAAGDGGSGGGGAAVLAICLGIAGLGFLMGSRFFSFLTS